LKSKEWISCKQYFNYECAYCGMTEEKHKELYKQQLHKEHAFPNGANDLSNCIPACKSCNSLKSNYEFIDWYNQENERFSEERIHMINRWLENDYKQFKR
jgi:5-methylcytosine-specific restriction endonuclease McrA